MHISKTIIQVLHDIYSDPKISHELAAPAGLQELRHSQIKKLTGYRDQFGDISFSYICIDISPKKGSDHQDCIMVSMNPFFEKLFYNEPKLQSTNVTLGDILQQINAQLNIDEEPTLSSAPRM